MAERGDLAPASFALLFSPSTGTSMAAGRSVYSSDPPTFKDFADKGNLSSVPPSTQGRVTQGQEFPQTFKDFADKGNLGNVLSITQGPGFIGTLATVLRSNPVRVSYTAYVTFLPRLPGV